MPNEETLRSQFEQEAMRRGLSLWRGNNGEYVDLEVRFGWKWATWAYRAGQMAHNESLQTAWQKLRANRGIIAFPERGWEDWEEVDKLVRALEPASK